MANHGAHHVGPLTVQRVAESRGVLNAGPRATSGRQRQQAGAAEQTKRSAHAPILVPRDTWGQTSGMEKKGATTGGRDRRHARRRGSNYCNARPPRVRPAFSSIIDAIEEDPVIRRTAVFVVPELGLEHLVHHVVHRGIEVVELAGSLRSKSSKERYTRGKIVAIFSLHTDRRSRRRHALSGSKGHAHVPSPKLG